MTLWFPITFDNLRKGTEIKKFENYSPIAYCLLYNKKTYMYLLGIPLPPPRETLETNDIGYLEGLPTWWEESMGLTLV
jgi:hypothetical protein